MSTNVPATTKGGAVVKFEYDATMVGRGYGGTTNADFLLPFVSILQSNSPQIANEQKRIPGAVPGMLFNTVTGKVVDGKAGMVFVPAAREHVYVEWLPRDKGGGFRGRHEVASETVKEAIASKRLSVKGNKPLLKDGNELVETFYVYGHVLDEAGAADTAESVVIAFTGTKIKKYKKFMTTLRTCKQMANAPLFAHQLRIRTVQESNKEGTFYNFEIEPVAGPDKVVESAIAPKLGDVAHPVLVAGLKLEEQVLGGLAKPNFDSQDEPGSTTPDGVF